MVLTRSSTTAPSTASTQSQVSMLAACMMCLPMEMYASFMLFWRMLWAQASASFIFVRTRAQFYVNNYLLKAIV
jgi:hypothetical protein